MPVENAILRSLPGVHHNLQFISDPYADVDVSSFFEEELLSSSQFPMKSESPQRGWGDSSGFMDIDEFMFHQPESDPPSPVPNPVLETKFQKRPDYDLVQSLATLGRLLKTEEDDSNSVQIQKTYLDSMTEVPQSIGDISDSNILNCFLPVKGVDFDQRSKEPEDDIKKHKSAFKPVIKPLKQTTQQGGITGHSISDLFSFAKMNPKMVINKTPNSDLQQPRKITIQAKPTIVPCTPPAYTSQALESLPPKPPEVRQIKKRKPRTYKYNPKPVQHKSSRAFVPDDLKDAEYWERRKRNNEAAKKSREERRKKELEILNGLDSLRRENSMLHEEVADLKEKNADLADKNLCLERQLEELLADKVDS